MIIIIIVLLIIIFFMFLHVLRSNAYLFKFRTVSGGLRVALNLVTRMNSQKIDGKEKASKRFKVFNHLVHAVKSTVS